MLTQLLQSLFSLCSVEGQKCLKGSCCWTYLSGRRIHSSVLLWAREEEAPMTEQKFGGHLHSNSGSAEVEVQFQFIPSRKS